ncbi:MAG: AI-2E family transporter [Acidobacteriota bacterium]
MRRFDKQNRGARVLLVTASLVIVIAGLREIRPIALPLLVAIFLSVLSSPLLGWLMRCRVPRALAVAITVFANVAVLALALILVGGSVRAFAESLPLYQERIEVQARATLDWLEDRGIDTSQFDWLQEEPTPLPVPPGTVPSGSVSSVTGGPLAPDEEQVGFIALGDVVDFVSSTVRSIASLLTMGLLVILSMIFLLLEAAGLPRRLEIAFGWTQDDLARLANMKLQVQRYLGYKTLISLITALLVGIWVWLLGVNFPLLWALIAFALNYIPSIGSIIAAIPAVILALVDLGPGTALLVVLGYLVVNLTLGNVIEPQLMGRRLGISTLVVFLSLIFWGWLWGPVGMLLSVPLTMILRIALENTEDLRWMAQLIAANPGSRLPVAPAAATSAATAAGPERASGAPSHDAESPVL